MINFQLQYCIGGSQFRCLVALPPDPPRNFQPMKALHYLAIVLLVVVIFYLLIAGESLLLPLVIAVALWYLINTLATALGWLSIGRFSIPGPVRLGLSLLIFLAAIWGVVEFIGSTFGGVREMAPVYQENLIRRVESLSIPFVDLGQLRSENFGQVINDWFNLPGFATSLASSAAGVLASSSLILIYVGFLFLEQGKFRKKIEALVSDPEREEEVHGIIRRIREDIQKYISIKMFTSTLTGLLSFGLLLLMGVDFAGIWGLLIFLLNFIPTIGSIIATMFPAMIALAQSDGYFLFLLVLIGIGALQMVIGNVLEPRLMGTSFNLSPIVILLNLALWNTIWGIPGMFLCVPFLIIFTIIMKHFPKTRPIAIILSSDGAVAAPTESYSFGGAAPMLGSDQSGGQDRKGGD